MNFKLKLLLLGFFVTAFCNTPAQAMGERQNYATSNICNTSDRIKTFTLVSPDEKKSVKETFKVPLRYMNMIFERQGKVDTSLHIAADWNTLEPQCQKDGNLVDGEEAFFLELLATANKDNVISFMKASYDRTEVYEDVFLDKYPNFRVRDRKRQIGPIKKHSTSRKIAFYPHGTNPLPVDSLIECDTMLDIQSIGNCHLRFMYKDTILVKTSFHSSKIDMWAQAYEKSVELITKFYSK